MIRIILILLIIIIVYKIYTTQTNYKDEEFINITNPFVDGLSQFQLGADAPDDYSFLDPNTLPKNRQSNKNVLNNIDKFSKQVNNKKSRLDDNVKLVNSLKNSIKNKKNLKHINNLKDNNSFNKYIPCKKVNKIFVETQFNDSYRDVLTAFFGICPNQKRIFNLQTLPVITTMYKIDTNTPFEFVKLTTQFLNKLNNQIKKLPESFEIINTYNNYLPLTSQLKKYVENRGINKFYKDIGVNFNLYADTPPNSPVELIRFLRLTREYTEAETKYIVTMVLKKILKSVKDQIQITVHFVTKNDPLYGFSMFGAHPPPQNINTTQEVAVEYIFIDGYFTNDFNVDYECAAPNSQDVYNIGANEDFYEFDALGRDNLISDHEVIVEFNKKLREHEIEMNNFNINVPYPVYDNPNVAVPPSFPTSLIED